MDMIRRGAELGEEIIAMVHKLQTERVVLYSTLYVQKYLKFFNGIVICQAK